VLRAIPDLIAGLTAVLPVWALALLAVVAAAVGIPAWVRSVRGKQIRGKLRTAAGLRGEERATKIMAAFTLADDRPARLLLIVEAGMKNGLPEAWKPALASLESMGALTLDTARIRNKIERERKGPGHPIEICVRVEELVAHDLHELAQDTLAEGLAAWPDDEDLLQLARRLETSEPPG
jgi:hypothetical protein